MSRLGDIRRGRGRSSDINIAPLIDMIFILLIFFMVSTTFVRNYKIKIERPGASSAHLADLRALRILVDGQGNVYIDGQSVHRWMIQSRVRELLAQNRERPVLVMADRRLNTGQLVQVVDQCRLAGAKNVGVDVRRKR